MRVLLAILALAAIGCSPADHDAATTTEDRPLHGRAAILAEHVAPIPNDTLATISPSFDAHFEPVGMLELSDEVLLSSVSSIDIDSEGRILAFERGGVYLFAPGGELISELSPDPCDPGYNFSPQSASFRPDGRILVTSGPVDPLVFDREGRCIEKLITRRFARYTSPASVGIYQVFAPADSMFLALFDEAGQQTDRWEIESPFPNLNSRMVSGGLVSNDEKAYLAISTDASVRVFEPGAAETTIAEVPAEFVPATEDLAAVRGMEALMEAMRALPRRTMTTRLMLLDQNRLVQFFNHGEETFATSERGSALRVIDTTGKTLHGPPIEYRGYQRNFVGGVDGLLIRSIPPTLESGNPSLVLYRFTG